MTAADTFISIEPFQVEHGDRLAGVPAAFTSPVDGIFYDGATGQWVFYSGERELCRRWPWQRVQVVRPVSLADYVEAASCLTGGGDVPAPAGAVECPPAGGLTAPRSGVAGSGVNRVTSPRFTPVRCLPLTGRAVRRGRGLWTVVE